jgi:hypothetical protein
MLHAHAHSVSLQFLLPSATTSYTLSILSMNNIVAFAPDLKITGVSEIVYGSKICTFESSKYFHVSLKNYSLVQVNVHGWTSMHIFPLIYFS